MDKKELPIQKFPLSWRFTDPQYHLLPSDDLAQIHPVAEAKAKELWNIHKTFLLPNQEGLSSHVFQKMVQMPTSGDATLVQSWLQTTIPQEGEVIVQWTPSLAVTAPIQLFCLYWDDFCYPSTDDVLIYPCMNQTFDSWAIFYHHEGVFFVGKNFIPENTDLSP